MRIQSSNWSAAQPRVKATWGKRRERLESGSVSSFQKPRDLLTPQAPYANVGQFDFQMMDN
ncbi:hypothetical protein H8E77_01475 [bacterium]|nr:hypothetical protein [bacterium]